MSNVTPLPAPAQAPAVQPDRAGFGDLRAELHRRADDLDLVELWAELPHAERRVLLKSADLKNDTTQQISQLNKAERDALRGAIHRMSGYASRLKGTLNGHRPHPSAELASHAREALAEGNTKAALHWLSLIEKGVV
ncbi:hypothetical protein L0636_07790 [Halomonas janggokensis]|uniref:Uncharacterized protein n=1 Tax=Vreelandella subterranea TaxID=416874 RepID=A0A1H9WG79_9GAMM|nr:MULTISPECIES: hypothetical protein [Halomonas]MCZ0930324.1 hypothetical protein [Halomonas janggokensis]SES32769.1 hypothetical protein SAMN04487958_11493 [Halomonas subterranea]